MQQKNWEKVKEILPEVLNLAPSERSAFLDNADLNDEVRAEIESLLLYEREAENLMELPAAEFSKQFFEDDQETDNALIGQNIGIYRVLRELGTGGMGAVYLAERTDGKFEQRVALKLLKREMNTGEIRRRFEQERKILASLEHPNIARLLDAGATGEKIPFLAMEYVEGLPITEYCASRNLNLQARLDLFREVCSAVNFAHRNLVVHRDLKPSNIFVTNDGVPKLLDFGISKILSAEFENLNAATVTKLGAMTPAYASPEQLQSESVTTATDIYSLGVILYELLSRHRPFEDKEKDLKEIYRAVIENDPPLPSAMIETQSKELREKNEAETEIKRGNLFDTEETLGKSKRKTEAHKFQQTNPKTIAITSQNLRGDLDNIILKALRKEPERRYLSAEDLAADIKRYLQGLPVTARPNTFSYRAGKFFKRNRVAVAAGALLLIVIIAGIIATLWQAQIAKAERAKAEKRFNDVRTLANSFLFEFSPKIENLPGSMPARQLLVTRALEYLDNLATEAGDDLQFQSELAKAYEKVGDVQGNPAMPNIGDIKGALGSYDKSLAIRRKLLANSPESLEAKSNLAANLEVSADMLLNTGDLEPAEAKLAEAVTLREQVVQANSQDLNARFNLGRALRVSGFPPFYNGENEKANEFYFRAMDVLSKVVQENPDDPLVAYTYNNLFLDVGESYAYMDQMKLAAENIEKGLQMQIALYERFPTDNRTRRALFVAYVKRAENYRDMDDFTNSLQTYNKALELAEESLKLNAGSFQAKRDLVIASKQRAITFRRINKYKESIEALEQVRRLYEELRRDDPNNEAIIYDLAANYQEISETYYFWNNYPASLEAAGKAIEKCNEILRKLPEHTQAQKIIAKAKYFTGNNYLALAEKNNQSDSRQKALEYFKSSISDFQKLKDEGKFTAPDQKVVEDAQKEIRKIQNKSRNI